MKKGHCCVYFAKCIGPRGDDMGAYKIGCSHGYEMRVRQVAANLPFELEVVGTVQGGGLLEAACHIHLRKWKIAGEYFHASDEVVKFIENASKEGQAFRYFMTGGTDNIGGVALPAVEAFLRVHKLTEEEVREFIGTPKKTFYGQRTLRIPTRPFVAAAGVLLNGRRIYSKWPDDALNELCKLSVESSAFVEAAQ